MYTGLCSYGCTGSLPATWNYGAVERALRDSSVRGDRCIFDPVVGKVFDSPGEAFEFYNMYSWEKGFGIRFGKNRANSTGRRSRQDLVCACEVSFTCHDLIIVTKIDKKILTVYILPMQGRDSNPLGRSVRTGCQAMVRLLRGEDDCWVVSRFLDVHNHPMSSGSGERRQWQSHSRIDQMTRDLVRHLRDNNVQISRVCSIIGSMHGSSVYVPFSRQSIRSLCGRLAQESITGDMTKTMELFAGMRSVDPGLVVRMDLDEGNRVRSLFWCHGRSRLDYTCFGDAITFDTTYRTNLYNLPFGLFVGVNNHFQSVIFGGVLLTEETIEAFQWAFRTFLEAMGCSAPKTILTGTTSLAFR